MRRKRTQHTSLTENGLRLSTALRRSGLRPHPGPIHSHTGRGGAFRIKITSETGRTRLRVTGGGVQQIFLYGTVEIVELEKIITEAFGRSVIETITSQRTVFPRARVRE